MKILNPIFVSILLLLTAYANANVLVVDNNPVNSPQYNSWNAANVVAVDGDTILLQPTGISYGTISITKELTVIGGGHQPGANGYTLCGTINMFNPNTTVMGLQAAGITARSTNQKVINCKMTGMTVISSGADVLILGNVVLGGISVDVFSSDILVINNYFSTIQVMIAGGHESCLIQNNIFYREPGQTTSIFATNASLSIFSENVFIVSEVEQMDPTNCTNCSFLNNLTWSPNGILVELPNSEMNNLEPTWTDVELGFDYDDDYHMLSGLPSNSGSDGGQIGIHGGLTGESFIYSGRPAIIPFVTSLTILNPVVQSNGQIEVTFDAVSGSNQED